MTRSEWLSGLKPGDLVVVDPGRGDEYIAAVGALDRNKIIVGRLRFGEMTGLDLRGRNIKSLLALDLSAARRIAAATMPKLAEALANAIYHPDDAIAIGRALLAAPGIVWPSAWTPDLIRVFAELDRLEKEAGGSSAAMVAEMRRGGTV